MSNLFLTLAVGGSTGFCYDSANIFQVIGYILMIFKIVIPVILIILGMIDLGKAVVASKDDEIKKAVKSLGMRALAAVVIFFVPTLVGIVMGRVSAFSDKMKEDYNICKDCLVNPNKSSCKAAADKANGSLN